MDIKLSLRVKQNLKILCIQTRRLLWLREKQLVKQLANQNVLLLEKQKLAEHDVQKELLLASST